jgi:glutamate N-acetyltransferase / amino-acid N-acetyltransferase
LFLSWGRILAATGSVSLLPSSTGAPAPTIDPTTVNVTFVPSDGTPSLPVLVNGEPEKVDEARAKEILSLEDFEVLVDLGMRGDGVARYWTCDFSYVSWNSPCISFADYVFRIGICENQWGLSQLDGFVR